MKPWSRFLACAAFGLLATAAASAAPIMSPSGVSATAASAAPGEAITITVSAANGGAATPADDLGVGGTITGTVTFTHRVTGHTISTGSVAFTTTAIVTGAGGAGDFTRTFTIPTVTSQAGAYDASVTLTGASSGTASGSFTSTSVLTVTGTPDLDITALTYPAGTAYRGGDVIPMTLSFTNRTSSNGSNNVPYVSSTNSNASFFRIEVVLSSNPVFGDADDFLLAFHDVSASSSAPLNANNTATTLSWNQLLPGNFAGSYYVLAKIDTQGGITETVEADLSDNGNNIYFTPDNSATRIALLPTNFPTVYWASTSGDAYSDNPSVSGDGRYTAFASDATSLGTNDTNGVRDIFLYDNLNSSVRKVTLSQQGTQTNAASNNPALSANGTYVAFASEATNLLTDDSNGFSDIYVINVLTGTLARVSVATAGTQANGGSFKPAISATGRYIAFESTATNLIAAGTTVGVTHIYLRDRDVSGSGTFDTAGNVSTVLISQSSGGTAGNGNSIQASISGGGGYVAFASDATNLGGTVTSGIRNVYLRDVAGSTTTLASFDTGAGAADGSSRAPSLNQNNGTAAGNFADGRYIAFGSEATDLVASDTNGISDIFVYDRVAATISRVSVDSSNNEGGDPSSTTAQRLGSINPSISSTGRYVAFSSHVATFTRGDNGGQYQGSGATATATVAAGAVTAVNLGAAGTQYSQTLPPSVVFFGGGGSGASATAVVSAAGVITGFTNLAGGSGYTSAPTVLIASDANASLDVFVMDRDSGGTVTSGAGTLGTAGNIATSLASVNRFGYQTLSVAGTATTAASDVYPVISGDGRYVAFPSDAESTSGLNHGSTNRSSSDSNTFRDIFVYDRRINTLPSTSSPPTVSITSPVTGTTYPVNTALTLVGSATASSGTIASVQFFVNGTSLGSDTSFPYNATWTPTAVGTFALSALVTDSFGNQAVSSNVNITISAVSPTSPTVSITSPAGGASLFANSANTISANASDTDGTIASVAFYANNVLVGTDTTFPYSITFTPVATGSYSLTAVATDNGGNQTTSAGVSVSVTNLAAPAISIVSPTPVQINSATTITATATSGGSVASVQFLANGASLGTLTTAPFTFSWTPTAAGTYTLTAVATDNLGSQTTSAGITVVVSSGTSPVISIAAPTTGSTVNVNTAQTVTATATDADGTVASVAFTVNGSALATVTTFPFTTTWTPVTAGTYTLLAVATDNLGNQTTSTAVSITVSTGTAPSAVSITSPAAGPIAIGSIVTVTGAATANSGNIASLQFFANGVAFGTDTTSPYTASWTPTDTGAYSLTVIATDTLGNRTTSAAVAMTVGANTAPTVSITAPLLAATALVATAVDATASDSDGTITGVQFFANGVSIGTDTTSPYSVSWTPTVSGSVTLTATATDNLGLTTTATNAITVAAGNLPTVALDSPAGGTTVPVNSTQTLTASATANVSGATIASVQFFANGVSLGSDTTFPYTATWSPVATGTYSLVAVATDSSGNARSTSGSSITVSAATPGAPTISLVAPITATTATVNQQVILAAIATDPDGVVANVEFTVNGTIVGSKSTAPYFVAWTPTATGAQSITATVTDNQNNRTTTAATTLTVAAATGTVQVASLFFNNPALDATATAPDPSVPVNVTIGSRLVLSALAVDTTPGTIASVQFYANGASIVTDASSPFYTTTYQLTTLGSVVLTALVTDSSGNQIYTFPLFLTSQPSTQAASSAVTLVSPANGATYAVGQQIVFQATHNFGSDTPPSIDFYLNGSAATTVSSEPYQFIRGLVRAGTYDVHAVVRSGTTTTFSNLATITVTSNTAPSVAISSPAAASSTTVGTAISIVATASDTDGTIANVQFFANGAALGTDTTVPYGFTFNPGAAGTYILTAIATDSNGEQTLSSGVTVSVTAGATPTVSVTAPAQLAAGSSATITATAAAGAASGTIAGVQFFANGASIGTDTSFPYSITFSPASTGTYAITALATDTLGNIGTSSASNIVVATNAAPAAVAITSGNTAFNLGATHTITATASDADGSIASVQFLVDGVAIGTDTTSTYSFDWRPTVAGTYALTVIATDNLGATTTSAAVNITANTGDAPTVAFTFPLNAGALAVNTPVTLAANASGATAALTIASVQFFSGSTALGTDTAFPYTATFTPSTLGAHTLRALATDSSGNQATTSITVTVQANAAPVVSIDSPVAGATPQVGTATTITATATDADGAIASMQFLANGTSIGTDTTSPYSVSWTPTINGVYLLTTIATDNVGATTTSSSVSVTAGGGNAPTGSITAPTGGTIAVGSTTTITAIASATATGATVASVDFLDNNASLGADTTFPYTGSWTPLSTGSHSLQVLVTDTLGNRFISAAVTVTVATNSAPTAVAITTPAAGATPGVGQATTVTATATDSDGSIASVQFFAGTALIGTATGTSPFSISWTPTAPSGGAISLTAVATDNLGATTTSAAVSVTVTGGNAPTVAISSPATGSSVQINSANLITATASAATGTIASVQFSVNGTAIGTDTTFPYTATWTPTTNGVYSIVATATDTAGNSATATAISVTAITGSAPTVSIVNPNTGGTYIAAKEILFDAVASDSDGTITQVELIANGVIVATDTGSPYFTNWSPQSPGTYTLIARATDNAGNTTNSAAITITVTQNTPPTINLVSPAAGTTFTLGSGVVFFATASDANGTINNVRFLANGDLIGTPDTAAPFTTIWTPAATGSYSILAIGVDNDLNASTGAPRTVNIVAPVGLAPTVVLTNPANGVSLTTASTVTLRAAAADADGTIANVAFYDNGTIVGAADTTAPYEVNWSPTDAGAHRLFAIATDNSGNVIASVPIDVTVNVASSTAPTVALTDPGAQTVRVPVALQATANDPDGIVSSVQFFDDGLPIASSGAAPFTVTWTPNRAGTHLLTAVATDNTGNQVVSTAVSVTVAAGAAPTVTIDAPAAGTVVPANFARAITATATATTGTIASVQFFANGVSLTTDLAFPYEASWTPTALGAYSLTAIATDTAGNQATSAAIAVTVAANASPTVAITAPAAGALGVGITAAVTATASDTDGTIASVQFFANGVSLGAADTTAPYTASFSSPIAGTFNLTAVAIDNLGATTTSALVAMTVTGGNAPTVTITTPPTGTAVATGSTNTITAAATPAGAGNTIASVQFFANSVAIGTDTTFPYTATWTPVANGSYAITALAVDTAGNQGTSGSITVTVAANVAPTVAVSAPAAAAVLPIGTALSVDATASDADGAVASVQFFVAIDGASPVSLGTDTTSPFSVSFTPTTAATYVFTAVATDNLGLTTTSAGVSTTTSVGSAPTVTVTAPTAGASIPANSTTSITADASAAAGRTITSVQFQVNGVSVGTDTTVPYAVSWTPTAAATYSLAAIATDSTGLTTTSTAVSVTVALNSAPTISLATTPGVSIGNEATITATTADTDGTVASVQFFAALGTAAPVSLGTVSAPTAFTMTWTPRIAGTYTLTAVATDNLGATTTSAGLSVTPAAGNAPNVTAPGGVAATIAANSAQTVTVTATPVGAGNTIASVQFFANGVSLGTDTTFPYTAAWTPTATGSFALTALATDTAGNQTLSATTTITVQANVAPTITVTAPAALGVGVQTTLTATPADADGTITSVQFFANGTALGTAITAAPYTVNFTSNVAGTIAITATATDNLGTTTTSAPATITVTGGNAPTVAITAPATGSTVPVNVTQSVTASATAVVGTIASVEFRVTSGGTTTTLGTDTTFPYAATWTPTSVGTYTLTALATDTSGNQGVGSATITVTATSNAGPSISIISPAAGNTFTAGGGVVLFANASDANGTVSSVRFLVDGQVIGAPITLAPYTAVWTPTVAGAYSVTAIAVDNDFNATTSTAIAVTINAVAGVLPTATITSPSAGTVLTTRSTVPITVGVSSLAVTSVQFFDNGVSIGTDNTAPFAIDWSPTTPGSHRLVAVATAGTNIVSSAPVDLVVNAATSPNAPIVTLSSPTAGALVAIGTVPAATVALSASASDTDGTIAQVDFFVNGTLAGSVTAFPYTVTFTPTSIGSYTVFALATDNAGNVSTSTAVTFTAIASGAPTVAITTPAVGASIPVNTTQTVDATATPAPGRTITSVRFFANGVLIGTDNAFPYSVNWTPPSTGSVALTAEATDDLTVPGTSPAINVTVSPGVPPAGSITGPATGSNITVGQPTTITANATATLPATVASVDFRVNGVSVGIDTTFPYSVSYTPTALGTGFQITAVITDSQSNTLTTAAVTVNVISAPGPTVSVTAPAAGSTIVVGTPTSVTAAAAGQNGATIGSVEFFANNVSIGTVTTVPYAVTWLPTTGGAVALTARATDSNGTQTLSAAVSVNVTTPPASVAITSPVAGTSLPVNTPTTIAATASTTTGTVVGVEFFVNGVAILTDTTFPFSAPWTPLTPGIFALTARATDNFGTITTSTVITVSVSGGNVPNVSISSPASQSAIAANTPQVVVVNAVAANGTIAQVQLLANGVSVGIDTAFPYNFAWTPTGLGGVSLTAVATDSQGTQSTSAPVSVTVVGLSAGAPTVAVTAPAAGAALPVGVATLLSANATDADGTIAQVEFFANGVSLAVDTVFPYNFSFTPGATGSYVITARATDNGGNIATSAAVSVSVTGGTAPSVAISAPASGATLGVNTPQEITATATSPSGFITSVAFFLNGAPLTTDTSFPYASAWTPGAVGTYTLTARATDNLGNITDSAVVTVTVGASNAPTVALSNPVNGSSYTVGTPLTVAANAADSDGTIAQVQFFVNGVPLNAADLVSPYSTTWTATSPGVYTLTAQATDNNGNVTSSSAVTVTIGANAAPTVALTSPVAGSYSLGNLVLVSANANDSDGTVASVQFFANGLAVGTATTAPFSTSWRPTLPGTFTITAQATDNVGNVTTAAPVSVTITSTAAPTVTITNPVVGTAYGVGNAIPFAATPSGGNGPIAQVQFFVNGTSLGAADAISPYSAVWTPNAPGTYLLLAVATDSAGLSSSTSATLSINISGNNAPSVAMTSPVSGTSVNGGATVNLTAVASDADGTIASVRFIANGNIVGTATTIPFSTAWVPSAAGSYTVTAQATDSSGNVTNSAPITVTVVANRSPTVALTAPGNGSTVRVGSGTNLTATANDTDGTIASVQFFANGLAVGAADTTAPYGAVFTPGAEGIYRITATALDNSGAATISPQITVLAVIPGAKGADISYSGNYQGAGESGRFAAINVRGSNATFIAFSNTTPNRVYFFSGLSVDTNGGFSLFDTVGRSLISGSASDTGATGTLDAGRLTFIGTISFGSGAGIATGYYTGSITGRPESVFAGLVGADGTITIYVSDGTFQDAGSGVVSTNGNFTVTTLTGTRFTGRADPATGFITGAITGGLGGSFTAAISSGVSFSDGFLKNLSTRGQVGTGGDILIAGFIVAGEEPKQVLIRAIGPSLAGFGVTGALADTQLQLFNGNTLVATNDNWGGSAAVSTASNQAGAFPLSPSSLDSVIYTALPPGSYTAQVSGVGGRTGIALIELYDTDNLQPFSAQKVTNVATRGVVGTGPNQLIAGFVVSGNTAKKVLIRAVGPTLGAAPFNVGGVLNDPILKLVRSNGGDTIVRENDNWEMGNDAALINEAAAKVGAFPLAAGGRDAAMLINLPPGTYSAQVTGPGTTTGVALVEVYEVP